MKSSPSACSSPSAGRFPGWGASTCCSPCAAPPARCLVARRLVAQARARVALPSLSPSPHRHSHTGARAQPLPLLQRSHRTRRPQLCKLCYIERAARQGDLGKCWRGRRGRRGRRRWGWGEARWGREGGGAADARACCARTSLRLSDARHWMCHSVAKTRCSSLLDRHHQRVPLVQPRRQPENPHHKNTNRDEHEHHSAVVSGGAREHARVGVSVTVRRRGGAQRRSERDAARAAQWRRTRRERRAQFSAHSPRPPQRDQSKRT